MQNRNELKKSDDFLLRTIGTSGYTVFINYVRAGAEKLISTYPADWQQEYDSKKYIWADPILIGSVMKNGNRRWSEIALPDPFGVAHAAAQHGLVYGASFTRFSKCGEIPSMLSVSRSDREVLDDEIEVLSNWFDDYSSLFDLSFDLTEKEKEALSLMARGLTVAKAAEAAEISPSAMKNRLTSCRNKLDATTNIQATLIASQKRII